MRYREMAAELGTFIINVKSLADNPSPPDSRKPMA
jgi:hypothetical protein